MTGDRSCRCSTWGACRGKRTGGAPSLRAVARAGTRAARRQTPTGRSGRHTRPAPPRRARRSAARRPRRSPPGDSPGRSQSPPARCDALAPSPDRRCAPSARVSRPAATAHDRPSGRDARRNRRRTGPERMHAPFAPRRRGIPGRLLRRPRAARLARPPEAGLLPARERRAAYFESRVRSASASPCPAAAPR